MHTKQLLYKVVLLLAVLHGNAAYSQDISWMKGVWNEYSGAPYSMPAVKCHNILQITTVQDSAFAGLQTTFFAKDTTVKIAYACNGIIMQEEAQFHRGNLVYKKNSVHPNLSWNNCGACNARTCSLYVEDNKIILLITTKDCDSTCNGTVAYYRDIYNFDIRTQRLLLSMYTKPLQSNIPASYNISTAGNNRIINKTVVQDQDDDTLVINSPLDNTALPTILRERKNKLMQMLQITSPNIEVILLDDAEIDGDIISLYHNNEEVIHHKTLGKEVIKYTLRADKQHSYHEFILVAENLGSIPPNTALMRIRAGDKKYELTTRANMHENAKVIVEYTGN